MSIRPHCLPHSRRGRDIFDPPQNCWAAKWLKINDCICKLTRFRNFWITCLGDGRIFLGRISPPDEERLWLLELLRTSPDSSDKESKLSVDCPVRMRFSGEDSSAKLWRGGEVSELPPDLGPTGKVVRPNLKIRYCFKWQEIVTEFVTDYDS